MRIFLTGATGFIGTHIIPELLTAGHTVLGLTRSEEGAQSLRAAGAEVHLGNLEDLESLRAGATQSEAVIHCGFNHDFSKFVANCQQDKRVIETLGAALQGSNRPLLITSGTGMGNTDPGRPGLESNQARADNPNPRVISELTGNALLESGLDVRVVRLPQVHDPVKQGLITPAVEIAREKGLSAYLGDGSNRWPAAHVSDVARLYRLVLEKGEKGGRYNAVAEEGVAVKDIAEVIGRGLLVPVQSLTPEEAGPHFGWLAAFAGLDMPASSASTRQRLGWNPTGPSLLSDLEGMHYEVVAR